MASRSIVFGIGYALGLGDDLVNIVSRDHDHTVRISKDVVARMNRHAADLNGITHRVHQPPSTHVSRSGVPAEDRESDLIDAVNVAAAAVHDVAPDAPQLQGFSG